MLEQVSRHGYSGAASFAIKLALEEGLCNAIKHGNCLDPRKKVHVAFEITAERAEITIRDEGPGFNPQAVPDPTVDENLEKPSGRGLMLMRAYMDHIRFNAAGNEVVMVKCNC